MNLENKKVLVIGLARSGMAAIKLLHELKADITLTERKPFEELKEKELLKQLNVRYLPQCPETFEEDFDMVVKNPGVPPVSDIVKRLNERKIKIITEIELAYMVSKPQHYIAITGTNGKTTTTTLVYELLKKAFGNKALVGGNIGTPLCELVLEHDLMHNEGYYISLEISNHQLVDIDTFKPEVSVIINMTPDHIETMGSLDNYYISKTLVYKNQDENDLFLLNKDDPIVKEYTDRYPIKAEIKTFSTESEDADSYLKDGYMYIYGKKVLPLDCVKIVGKHNLQNIMISLMAVKRYGMSDEDIIETVSSFKGVEHRIEFVREIDGVKYYNDSKATNTDATITALKAFEGNVILLVGGYEKGLDMTEMRKYLSPVKMIIGFGAAGKRIAGDLSEDAQIVSDLKEAVLLAKSIAVKGDVILLSPTTSSYDSYTGFEQRGRHFKEIVNAL